MPTASAVFNKNDVAVADADLYLPRPHDCVQALLSRISVP